MTDPHRFYAELQYTFDEASTATILRLSNTSMEDAVVLFEDETGVTASVTVTHCKEGMLEALADALDYANITLCVITRETTIPIPAPWAVKVVDGDGMERAMLSRLDIARQTPPREDDDHGGLIVRGAE